MAMLARMQAAHRQTLAHLRLIERQIAARAEGLVVTFRARSRDHGRSRTTWTQADEQFYLGKLSELTFLRHAEIEALSRKLTRQEAAIAGFRCRHSLSDADPEQERARIRAA
jgi:hypothetical protein